jgi:murein L,D-transpeptidase YcbB/YkuD
MSPKWLVPAAVALGLALDGSAWAEPEANHVKQWRPKGGNAGFDIFGGFSNRKKRFYDPETSVGGGVAPAPAQRVIPVQILQGNLDYVPEKFEPLKDRNSKAARPLGLLASAIYDELKSDRPTARVLPAERQVILEHYRNTGFQPLWVTPLGPSDRARNLLAKFKTAAEEGLDPNDYALPVLGGLDVPHGDFANDAEHLARFDLELTAMAMTYARHASGGRLVPGRLTTYNDIKAPRIDPKSAMRMIALSPFAAEWLQTLHPTHPAYQAFKTELAALRAAEGTEIDQPVERGKRLKLGEADDRIPQLRRKLIRMGFLEETPDPFAYLPRHIAANAAKAQEGSDLVFDEALHTALKAMQKKHNLKQSGILDELTIRTLNNQGPEKNMARLEINMERLRWLPKSLGQRHVFVNQAAYELWIADNGREIWRTKVVVGKADTQTTAFHDTMETVVFNPSWGVPPSILTNEMLPILWRDPSYLDRKGFTVIDKSGKKIPSVNVNWAAYGANAPFSIMQPPGEDNALGEVKFLFPNHHAIYMHDTPSRQLFSRPARAFSHGCVRVENPRRLAEIVLGYSPADVAKRIESGRSQSVSLKSKLPVHITYFTAWPSASGKVEYYNDIYGRDIYAGAALKMKWVAAK